MAYSLHTKAVEEFQHEDPWVGAPQKTANSLLSVLSYNRNNHAVTCSRILDAASPYIGIVAFVIIDSSYSTVGKISSNRRKTVVP